MPRPAPRVAPATTATRPVSGFLPATGRVRDLAASGDCLGRPAIAIPPDADHRRTNRCISTGVWSARKGLRRVDRKSTRLNSSHGYISYAVFCLKKKKKFNLDHRPTNNHYTPCPYDG